MNVRKTKLFYIGVASKYVSVAINMKRCGLKKLPDISGTDPPCLSAISKCGVNI